MLKKKNKIIYIGIVLAALIIVAAAAGIRNQFRKEVPQAQAQQLEGENAMKAVYLQKEDGNSIFINLTDEYPFTGAIPQGELYDEDGEKITEKDLNNGDVLDIWGNGVIAESYPAQYNGITKVQRTEQANQKYIEEYSHYLEELFVEKDPSQRPNLNVCYTDDLAQVTVIIPDTLSYTWTYEDQNGESQTITTDGPHILQTESTEITKLSEPIQMELEFDEKPESIQLLSWEDSLLGQYQDSAAQLPEGAAVEVKENEKSKLEVTAQPGNIYQVRGQWKNGTADYGFWVPVK